jgi:hypothetical protein
MYIDVWFAVMIVIVSLFQMQTIAHLILGILLTFTPTGVWTQCTAGKYTSDIIEILYQLI